MEVPTTYRQSAPTHFGEAKPSFQMLLRELFGYGIASVVALGVDMGILKALVSGLGWQYLIAATVSFTMGALVAYILSVKLAFRFREVSTSSIELVVFVALGVAGLLVNMAVMSLCVSGIGMAVLEAKLISAVCTFLTNFTLRKVVLFSPRQVRR